MPLAVAGLAVAIGVGIYKMVFSQSYTSDEVPAAKKLGDSLCIVASESKDYSGLLQAYPRLVIVGAQNISLKSGGADDYRLIETETADGWIHVVKHLRPERLVAEEELVSKLPAGIERFVKNVLTKGEAADFGLEY